MRTAVIALFAIVFTAVAINAVYAKSVNSKDWSLVETVKQKVAKVTKASMVKKLYFYEPSVIETAEAEGRADYTMWGQLTRHARKGSYIFNAHGLVEGREYALQYDSEVATGTANEYGDLHIRGIIDGEAWGTAQDGLVLADTESGETVLEVTSDKIKLPETEEIQ